MILHSQYVTKHSDINNIQHVLLNNKVKQIDVSNNSFYDISSAINEIRNSFNNNKIAWIAIYTANGK